MSNDQQLEGPVRKPDAKTAGEGPARLMQEVVESTFRAGPAYHPIFDKLESEHVTQFLTGSFEAENAERQTRRGNRWFLLGYVVIAVGVFAFLTSFLLPSHSEQYFALLQYLGTFVAGLGGGYGLKSYQDRRSK